MTEHAHWRTTRSGSAPRAWQREQARKTLAEIRAGAPGHGEVSEQEFDAGWDQLISEAEQGNSPGR